MRVEFKFHEAAPASRRKQIVEKVTKLGAKSVEPLFPAEKDPELASLYKADVPDDVSDSLVSKLDADESVEFAQRGAERKLIR